MEQQKKQTAQPEERMQHQKVSGQSKKQQENLAKHRIDG